MNNEPAPAPWPFDSRPAEPLPAQPETPAAASRGAGGVRVLVIDDEPEIRRALRTGLAGASFTVEWAPSGAQGMDLVARWRPAD